MESSTWNPEPTKLNPESKTVLDSLTWGDTRLIVEVLGRAMRTKITLRQEALTELETNPVRHKKTGSLSNDDGDGNDNGKKKQ